LTHLVGSKRSIRTTAKDNGSREELIGHINEAAHQVSAAALTFLALCVYVGVAVSSTSGEVLLLGTDIKLPLFDVAIPLERFYFLAPFLLAFLHLHLLLLQYLLARKIRHYLRGSNLSPRERDDRPFASLPVLVLLNSNPARLVRVLMQMIGVTVTMVLPLFLLLMTQAKFIPYHSMLITLWHMFLILADLFAIWYFSRRSRMPVTSRQRSSLKYRLFKACVSFVGVAVVLLSVSAPFASLVLASGAVADIKSNNRLASVLGKFFEPNLSLPEHALFENKEPAEEDHPREAAKGIQLTHRNLRMANLAGMSFVNADFRGANLEYASLRNSYLSGAKFSPRGTLDDRVNYLIPGVTSPSIPVEIRARQLELSTCLHGADLRGARLEDASFVLADLRDADLSGAHLERADLFMADLRGARLRGAYLNGARLEFALLDRVDLRDSEMWATNLSAASLLGSDLSRASPVAADLRWTDLRGAKLSEVYGDASDFTEAMTLGADFQNARLHGVVGLFVKGVDLRSARLGVSDLRGGNWRGDSPLETSDLRLIHFENISKGDWAKMTEKLQAKIPLGEMRTRALARVSAYSRENESRIPVSLVRLDTRGRSLLYYKEDLSGMLPEVSEREFYERLARLLVREACRDQKFAAVMVPDVLGDLAPRRPLLAQALARQVVSVFKGGCEGMRLVFVDQRKMDAIEKIVTENPLEIYDITDLFSHNNG
jgi:uncharacterized protein YjbI with pentapeptide repeats